MREVLTVPNGVLRQKCKSVKITTAKVKVLANDLMELLGVEHNGMITCSVAAPQVGESVRMFAYRGNPYSGVPDTRIIINPEIVSCRKLTLMRETCLSIPGKAFLVKRYKAVKVRGTDIYGRRCSFKGTGIIAQLFQHEINHLDGVLIDEIGELVTKR